MCDDERYDDTYATPLVNPTLQLVFSSMSIAESFAVPRQTLSQARGDQASGHNLATRKYTPKYRRSGSDIVFSRRYTHGLLIRTTKVFLSIRSIPATLL